MKNLIIAAAMAVIATSAQAISNCDSAEEMMSDLKKEYGEVIVWSGTQTDVNGVDETIYALTVNRKLNTWTLMETTTLAKGGTCILAVGHTSDFDW